MESLDYRTPERTNRRSGQRLVGRLLLVVLLGLLLSPIVFFALPIVWMIVGGAMGRPAVNAFNQRTSSAAVLGKTPAQVIAALGKPDYDASFPDGTRLLTYRGPNGADARIDLGVTACPLRRGGPGGVQ